MKLRLFHVLDAVAHVLYSPTMLGRPCARTRWHHQVHLIPGRWLAAVCDRYERWLGVTGDELARAVGGWRCPHGSVVYDGMTMGKPDVRCGCDMTPIPQ